MTFEPGATRQAADQKEDGYSFALYGVGSSTAITTSLEQGSIAAVAAWSDWSTWSIWVVWLCRLSEINRVIFWPIRLSSS